MRNRSPIYSLFHQEIRACAEHLLEMSQNKKLCLEKSAEHILGRMRELHQFASKVRPTEHYHALYALKHYLENTLLPYQDEEKSYQLMRLSEAISLLGIPVQAELKFQPVIVSSLTNQFVQHFLEESKPGRPLHRNLNDIKRL
jgi:hypothetical protein